MPSLSVPLTRHPPSHTRINIHYTVRGTGPVLVLLIPGLCVPASMYDDMSAVLSATTQFTTVAVDNRGIGLSDVPPASVFTTPGYNVTEFAHDIWDIADQVMADRAHSNSSSKHSSSIPSFPLPPLRSHVALVGHSMGGMIAQAMLALRPNRVRFVALISTHAGGMWNLLPTLSIIRSALRVAWSGFDRDVHASVNLNLHFTQRFLDDWIGTDVYPTPLNPPLLTDHVPSTPTSISSSPPQSHLNISNRTSSDSTDATTLHRRHTLQSSSSPSQLSSSPSASMPNLPHQPTLNFFESKVLEFARDAHIFFGLSPASLPEALRHPKHALLDAVASHRRPRLRRSRRFDIYHARYTGQDDPSASAPRLDITQSIPSPPPQSPAASRTSSNPPPDPASTDVLYGHIAVVRSHSLSRQFARRLRQCSSLFKLVVTGRHDSVITPSATRALASAVAANTLVELEAAHFVTDEVAAEVNTHVVYGLRKAFFVPRSRPCECSWCVSEENDPDKLSESCRMC